MTHARWLAGAAFLVLAVPAARGADFRIENKVFFGEDAVEPAAVTTTLFHAGRVYDFLDDGREITLFDPASGRFILIDPERKIKTEMKTSFVESLALKLKQQALAQSDEFVRFTAEPNFTDDADSPSGELTLAGQWMTYHVETLPADTDETARQYAAFSDAYARLNMLTSPLHLLPFPRLALNQALQRRSALPRTVELSITPPRRIGSSSKPIVIRTEHAVAWRLLDVDRQRIAEAGTQLATFQDVEWNIYRQPVDQLDDAAQR